MSKSAQPNLAELARAHNVPPTTLYYRIRQGVPLDQALQANINLRGKRQDCFGETMTIRDAARKYGIAHSTLSKRMLRCGVTLEEAVRMGRRNYTRCKYQWNGAPTTVRELARMAGVTPATIHYRIQRGETIDEAVKRGVNRKTHTPPPPPNDADHLARKFHDELFSPTLLYETRFRQTAPNEWRFDGDEMRYRVIVERGKCTFDAWHKFTGHKWMHREYAISQDSRMRLIEEV